MTKVPIVVGMVLRPPCDVHCHTVIVCHAKPFSSGVVWVRSMDQKAYCKIWAQSPMRRCAIFLDLGPLSAVARMEHNGVPIDAQALGLLRANWQAIQESLIREV